jgi:hypothetical protein
MLSETPIVNDAKTLIKSEMIRQIQRLGPTTPDALEQAVFKAVTGHERNEVDWDIEDNQAGYYAWIKSFDQLISELVEDGYIRVEETRTLLPTEAEPPIDYPQLTYPKKR